MVDTTSREDRVLQAVPHAHDRWDLFAIVTVVTIVLASLGIGYLTGLT